MAEQKCVVEGCDLEYDVICSFSFYNVNTSNHQPEDRQQWISGAMKEDGECLWRHVSLHLCGYHFEMDSQGLWIDSPMLPEILTLQKPPQSLKEPSEEQKIAAETIKLEHNYIAAGQEKPAEPISRLNVRQLVDTLGYLSLKNLQRKQLWVVKVETDKAEASIIESEQVITKMSEPQQIIEIIPQEKPTSKVFQLKEEGGGSRNSLEEVHDDATTEHQAWTLNIVPQEPKPKYAFIKHLNAGSKKRHFTSEVSEVEVPADFDNYYILPDVDPSTGVEVTTSDNQGYIVSEFDEVIMEMPTKKNRKEARLNLMKKRKREKELKMAAANTNQWILEETFDADESADYSPQKGNRRKTKAKNDLNIFGT